MDNTFRGENTSEVVPLVHCTDPAITRRNKKSVTNRVVSNADNFESSVPKHQQKVFNVYLA